MKQVKRNHRLGGAGLCVLLLAATGWARAQMIMLDSAKQDTARTSQAVNDAFDARLAAKARADQAAAEVWRNSPERLALERQQAQDEANKKLVADLKRAQEKAAACAREKANNGGSANFLFTNCD